MSINQIHSGVLEKLYSKKFWRSRKRPKIIKYCEEFESAKFDLLHFFVNTDKLQTKIEPIKRREGNESNEINERDKDEKQTAGIHNISRKSGWVISQNTDQISKYRPNTDHFLPIFPKSQYYRPKVFFTDLVVNTAILGP